MPLKELDAKPELRDNPSLKDFNSLEDLAKSHIEVRSMVGNSLRPPGPEASPEAKKEFRERLSKTVPDLFHLPEGDAEAEGRIWSKLGKPAKREEYKFAPPEGVDPSVIESLRDAAVEGGMTQKQFEALAKKTVAGAQNTAAEVKKGLDALKTEWGAAWQTKLQAAAALAQSAGISEGTVAAILGGRLPASQLKTWDYLATAVGSEGGLPGPGLGGGGPKNGLTRSEAELQVAEIQKNPAYFNAKLEGHDRLVGKMNELQAMLHPG